MGKVGVNIWYIVVFVTQMRSIIRLTDDWKDTQNDDTRGKQQNFSGPYRGFVISDILDNPKYDIRLLMISEYYKAWNTQ